MIPALLLLLAFQITPELRQHVDAGLKARSAGDFDKAVVEFRRVVELAPTLPAAHVNLGAAYLERKSYADAVASLTKALELDPNLAGAEGMLGAALLSQGYAAEAIPHLRKAQADGLIAIALLETNQPREALDRIEKALTAQPDNPDLLYYLGQAHSLLSKQAWEVLQAKGADSPRVPQWKGEVLAAAGQREAAIAQYRTALTRRPDLRGVHLALGELYVEAGDYEKAEAEFRAEATQAPGSAEAAWRLGSTLLTRGQVPAAIGELQRADKLQPGMPETLLDLGKAMNASGKPEEAIRYLNELLRHETGSKLAETAHFQLAQSLRRLGKTEEAARELKLFQELRGKTQ